MAFGRSNSLSINTGATNSLLTGIPPVYSAQQNQGQNNAASTQPQQSGSLFGGSLFGSTNQNQPQNQGTSGGLFGQAASNPQSGGNLFGNTNQQNQQNQQTGGSSLFGNTQQQQSQPQQSGSLFGSSLFGSNNQQSQQPQPQPQQQQSSSLFGGSLFGNNQQNQQQQQQQQQPAQQQPMAGGSSLFGGLGGNQNQQQQPQQQQLQQQPQQSVFQRAPPGPYSLFGASVNQSQPSLLRAQQYGGSAQYPGSFAGKLSMGQSSQPQGQAPSAQQYDWTTIRPTTRYSDLQDACKQELEKVDKMIQQQEQYCQQIEAILPKHGEDVESLGPDITLVKEKAEAAEAALTADAGGVQAMHKLIDGGRKDFLRCLRILQNQQLPPQYQNSGLAGQTRRTSKADDEDYDDDLEGNYFTPLAQQLQRTLEAYAGNLAEIEAHVRIIERSAVQQAQQLAVKRAGMGDQLVSGDDTVAELADTLRGFEQSILGAASAVGNCREGVNELVLGRLGGGLR